MEQFPLHPQSASDMLHAIYGSHNDLILKSTLKGELQEFFLFVNLADILKKCRLFHQFIHQDFPVIIFINQGQGFIDGLVRDLLLPEHVPEFDLPPLVKTELFTAICFGVAAFINKSFFLQGIQYLDQFIPGQAPAFEFQADVQFTLLFFGTDILCEFQGGFSIHLSFISCLPTVSF
jgi:hypothetical protein